MGLKCAPLDLTSGTAGAVGSRTPSLTAAGLPYSREDAQPLHGSGGLGPGGNAAAQCATGSLPEHRNFKEGNKPNCPCVGSGPLSRVLGLGCSALGPVARRSAF